MLRYSNKPPRKRQDEPVAKAIARQKAAVEVQRHLSRCAKMFYCGMVVCLALRGIGSLLPQPGETAQVGDMLKLSEAVAVPGAPRAVVPARLVTGPWAKPGGVCGLDESVMLKPGGVLTTMAVRPDGVMLTWNGGATAQGAASCPSSSQLLISREDYQKLYKIEVPRPPMNPR